MTPSLTDYLHGLRRMWWIPVLTTLVGLALGMLTASAAQPTTEATGTALFEFAFNEAGDNAAVPARSEEIAAAQSRLRVHVGTAATSPQVREILAASGIDDPPTAAWPSGALNDPSAPVQIDTREGEVGVVDVRVDSQELDLAEAEQLVTALTTEVSRQVLAIDMEQQTPALRTDPLITEPRAIEVSTSQTTSAAQLVLLLTMVGLGLVYLIVWRQGLIYARHDVEDRLGARVLGDFAERPADAPAIVLALTKGRESTTSVLIVPIPGSPSGSTGGLGEALAAASREMGLAVTLASADGSATRRISHSASETATTGTASAVDLDLVEARDGLDANALMAAGNVHIVTLAVTYGKTPYSDLEVARRTIAEVTDADLAVIGVHS